MKFYYSYLCFTLLPFFYFLFQGSIQWAHYSRGPWVPPDSDRFLHFVAHELDRLEGYFSDIALSLPWDASAVLLAIDGVTGGGEEDRGQSAVFILSTHTGCTQSAWLRTIEMGLGSLLRYCPPDFSTTRLNFWMRSHTLFVRRTSLGMSHP